MKTIGLCFICVLASCERTEPNASPIAPAADAIPVVEVVPVTSEKLATSAKLPGELTAYQVVALYSRVNGFVEEITVDRGARVHRGQILARLSAPELIAQRTEAESRLVGARSTLDRTRAAAETPGAVAQHDIELNDALVKANEARVRSLKALEDYLLVRAPFDGLITERNVHPGALVGPPTASAALPMLRLQSAGHLRLTVAVPEADVGAIAEGAKTDFSVRTWPGQRFVASVARISRSVDARTRTMPVELDVEDALGKLAPGMFAEVTWPIRREAASLFVPLTSVVQTTEKVFVDRVRDNIVEQISVERGTALKDRIEVFGALAVGDTVLRRGSEELKSGTKVTTKLGTADLGAAR